MNNSDWNSYYYNTRAFYDSKNIPTKPFPSQDNSRLPHQDVLPACPLAVCPVCLNLHGSNINCGMCGGTSPTIPSPVSLPFRFPFPCPFEADSAKSCPFGFGKCDACKHYQMFLSTNPCQRLSPNERHPYDSALLVAFEKWQKTLNLVDCVNQAELSNSLHATDALMKGTMYSRSVILKASHWIEMALLDSVPKFPLPHPRSDYAWTNPRLADAHNATYTFEFSDYLALSCNPLELFPAVHILCTLYDWYTEVTPEPPLPLHNEFLRQYGCEPRLYLTQIPFDLLLQASWYLAINHLRSVNNNITPDMNARNMQLVANCTLYDHAVLPHKRPVYRFIDLVVLLCCAIVQDPALHSLLMGDHRSETGRQIKKESQVGSYLADLMYTQIASVHGVLAPTAAHINAPNDTFVFLFESALRVLSESAQGRCSHKIAAYKHYLRTDTEYQSHLTRQHERKGDIMEAMVFALCERGYHMLSWTLLWVCFHKTYFDSSAPNPQLFEVC